MACVESPSSENTDADRRAACANERLRLPTGTHFPVSQWDVIVWLCGQELGFGNRKENQKQLFIFRRRPKSRQAPHVEQTLLFGFGKSSQGSSTPPVDALVFPMIERKSIVPNRIIAYINSAATQQQENEHAKELWTLFDYTRENKLRDSVMTGLSTAVDECIVHPTLRPAGTKLLCTARIGSADLNEAQLTSVVLCETHTNGNVVVARNGGRRLVPSYYTWTCLTEGQSVKVCLFGASSHGTVLHVGAQCTPDGQWWTLREDANCVFYHANQLLPVDTASCVPEAVRCAPMYGLFQKALTLLVYAQAAGIVLPKDAWLFARAYVRGWKSPLEHVVLRSGWSVLYWNTAFLEVGVITRVVQEGAVFAVKSCNTDSIWIMYIDNIILAAEPSSAAGSLSEAQVLFNGTGNSLDERRQIQVVLLECLQSDSMQETSSPAIRTFRAGDKVRVQYWACGRVGPQEYSVRNVDDTAPNWYQLSDQLPIWYHALQLHSAADARKAGHDDRKPSKPLFSITHGTLGPAATAADSD